MNLRTIRAQAETPAQLFTARRRVGTLVLDNPSATTTAYLKIYVRADTPTVATDAPTFEIPFGIGVTALPALNVDLGACWIAVGSVAGADATAPNAPCNITLSHDLP